MPRRLQSLLAIAAGFLLVIVLETGARAPWRGAFPGAYRAAFFSWWHAPIVGFTFVFTVLGSYLTALLAPRRPLRHAVELGVVYLLELLIHTFMLWRAAPDFFWHDAAFRFHVIAMALVLPAAYLGGTVRERQLSPA